MPLVEFEPCTNMGVRLHGHQDQQYVCIAWHIFLHLKEECGQARFMAFVEDTNKRGCVKCV